jgi:RimJ/RimL family protein N-acetyltransferase
LNVRVNAVEVPIIETERMVLRGWRNEDLDEFAALVADTTVMEFLGGTGDREEAWRTIATYVGHWQLRGYGLWVVERKTDGAVLGRVGLWNPEGWPGMEIGWTLARHAWGHGYAKEAARAVMRWAWEVLEAPRLISVIAPGNRRSIKVAESLGMRREREHLLGGSIPTVVYAIDRPGDD